MSRYRKFELATWNDERFCELSAPPPNGQTLWKYLIVGPRTTTFPGLIVAREAVMADDLGWPIEGFREAFAEVSGKGMARADWKAGLVVLPKALIDGSGDPRESTKPESPNVLKGWAKSWDSIPECSLKREYLRQLGSFAEALGEAFLQAFREGFRKALAKPSPNQEQEQEQEQERRDTEPATRLVLAPLNGSIRGTKSEIAKRSRRSKPKPKSDASPHELAIAATVLERLSARNGVAYSNSRPHVKLVVARLREGISELDLRAVIGHCASNLGWAENDKMREYLRPETLFGKESIHRYLPAARVWAAGQKPIVPTPPPKLPQETIDAITEAP